MHARHCWRTWAGEDGIATENKSNRRNNEIRVPRVRVIGADGEQVGILERDEALAMAEAAGMDLVEIQPTADPPVCRVMDFGKFKFDQKKKAHDARRRSRQVETKELKFRPTTDVGDYNIKLRNVFKFLDEGNKVKVNIRFRGREMRHQELGIELAQRIQKDITEHGVVDQFPRMEGRQMTMMISPKKK